MSNEIRVVWLVNSMGYDNKLLYWAPLLRTFIDEFPMTDILACGTDAKIEGTNYKVQKAISCAELSVGRRIVSVPLPSVLFRLAKTRPQVVVISEFGLLSLYGIVYRLLRTNVRVLLLVENDPVYLRPNGVNRSGAIHTMLRRLIVKAADKVLCNNKKTAVYLADELGAASGKVTCGCYLTSAIASVVSDRSVSRSGLVLLFVGRLIPSKGLIHLLRAIKMLGANSLDMLSLEVIGDGPERKVIQEEVKRLGLERVVTIHGAQPYGLLGEFFSRADIFVFPTLGDYRALVGFEALSAGLPVIGSIFDGAGEEIVDIGVNGFLVDPRNEADLSQKIQYFLSNPKAVEEFSVASRRKADKFSPKAAASNLVQACLACAHDRQTVDEG